MIDIKTPAFPESISEGTIATLHKTIGEHVEEGDIVAEIETDKVVMEVPALQSGVVSSILVNEGDTVLSQAIIMQLSQKEISNDNNNNNNEEENIVLKKTELLDSKFSAPELEIYSPVFPESVSEGTIASWLKTIGDLVEEGENLVEIETDKVMMEVPATASGIVKSIIKHEGDTVISNELIAVISQGEKVVAQKMKSLLLIQQRYRIYPHLFVAQQKQ